VDALPEHHLDPVHSEDLVLDIGDGIGALILYTTPELSGHEIEVSRLGSEGNRVHTAIHERRVNGRTVFAGVYPELPEGQYRIWSEDPSKPTTFTIVSGRITEIDWR
jgi:hypothetical protein